MSKNIKAKFKTKQQVTVKPGVDHSHVGDFDN